MHVRYLFFESLKFWLITKNVISVIKKESINEDFLFKVKWSIELFCDSLVFQIDNSLYLEHKYFGYFRDPSCFFCLCFISIVIFEILYVKRVVVLPTSVQILVLQVQDDRWEYVLLRVLLEQTLLSVNYF